MAASFSKASSFTFACRDSRWTRLPRISSFFSECVALQKS